MATEPTISCPQCGTEIKLTESLAGPLLAATRQKHEQQMAAVRADVAVRETEVRRQQAALAEAEGKIEEQVAAKVATERRAIAADEARKAKIAIGGELAERNEQLAELNQVLKARDETLAEAQGAQADLIRKQRELDDATREMDLTIEKRVQASLSSAREQARRDAEDALGLKVTEKELTIASMQKQIEDLKRRAEQGSQQLQGEVQELHLEETLRTAFPQDTIAPVPKGLHGGDVTHRVVGPMGQAGGTILWESKRTKNWSDAWLAKLRQDQRDAHADVAVIVSQTLPEGVDSFDLIDGVWITSYRCAIPVAVVLRHSVIELAAARQAGEGQQTKMELVYQYLTGPRFRHRVQAIVEKFADMQGDLDRERKTMTRLWAKREEQIRTVIDATAGMYGDLQGIAGRTLQEIDGLEIPLLEQGPTPATDSADEQE